MITKQRVAAKMSERLRHEISSESVVDWAEEVIREEDFADPDANDLASVVGRLGLDDVQEFGLSWEDCESLLRRLGYTAKVEITAA